MPTPLFIIPLLILLILIGLLAAMVALVRRHGEESQEPGIGTVRRLYFYSLSFAGLVASGIGAVLLLKTLLDALLGPRAISVGSTTLALGLALAIVGTPIWLLFWSLAQRSLRQFAVEAGAVSRKVYLYLVLGGSAVASSVGAIMFLRWAFGDGEFSGTQPALALVWAGVWAFHWKVENSDGQPTELSQSIRRVYVYLLALFGLALLAIGIGAVLRMALGGAYHRLFGASELLLGDFSIWNGATRTALAMALVGLVVWWWHWHRLARGDIAAELREVYLYLFAILGGAATVVVSLTVLIYHFLQWFIGRPETSSALLHFDVVPGLIAAITVGGAIWGYHRAVVKEEASVAASLPPRFSRWRRDQGVRPLPEAPSSFQEGSGQTQEKVQAARRMYGYLVASVGLVTLGVGLVILFATVIGILSPGSGRQLDGDDWWRNPLVLSITLLLVGGPVWGLYWRDMQRIAALGGPEERAALSRRVFIFLIFGLSVLLTLINLSIALFKVFDAALDQGLQANLLWEVRQNIAILLTAGAVSIYYWLVLQEDRRAVGAPLAAPLPEVATAPPPAPTQAQPRKSVTLLVSEADLPLVQRLEAHLGYNVQTWRWVEGPSAALEISDERLVEVAGQIIEGDPERVLLLRTDQGLEVCPYQILEPAQETI